MTAVVGDSMQHGPHCGMVWVWSPSIPGKNTRMQLRLFETSPNDVINPQTRPDHH